MNKNMYETCCGNCNASISIPFQTKLPVLCPKCFKAIGDDKKEEIIVVDMNHGRKRKKKEKAVHNDI